MAWWISTFKEEYFQKTCHKIKKTSSWDLVVDQLSPTPAYTMMCRIGMFKKHYCEKESWISSHVDLNGSKHSANLFCEIEELALRMIESGIHPSFMRNSHTNKDAMAGALLNTASSLRCSSLIDCHGDLLHPRGSLPAVLHWAVHLSLISALTTSPQ